MRAAKASLDLVRDGVVDQSHRAHLGFGDFTSFSDGIGDLAGFAKTNPNAALLVTGDYQSAKAETASAFDHFGGAIDENDLLRQLSHSFAGGGKHFRPTFGHSPVSSRRSAETSTAATSAFTPAASASDWFCHFFSPG